VKELVIESCLNVEKLNVRSNYLNNLEFLKKLKNLKELDLDNNTNIVSGLEYLPDSLQKFSCENTKLIEILKLYQGD
jgi:hypothetical protein